MYNATGSLSKSTYFNVHIVTHYCTLPTTSVVSHTYPYLFLYFSCVFSLNLHMYMRGVGVAIPPISSCYLCDNKSLFSLFLLLFFSHLLLSHFHLSCPFDPSPTFHHPHPYLPLSLPHSSRCWGRLQDFNSAGLKQTNELPVKRKRK